MQDQTAQIARELLELEAVARTTRLAGAQLERWAELAGKLFGRSANDSGRFRRRSFRLSSELKAEIETQHATVTCMVVQISQLGLSVRGNGLQALVHGKDWEVVKVTFSDHELPLGLQCRVASVDPRGPAPAFGLEISKKNPQEVRKKFIERVYHPVYIQHLERLRGLP